MAQNTQALLKRGIKEILPSMSKAGLVAALDLLADKAEWDEDRNRALVVLSIVGAKSVLREAEQITAKTEHDKKVAAREKGSADRKSVDLQVEALAKDATTANAIAAFEAPMDPASGTPDEGDVKRDDQLDFFESRHDDINLRPEPAHA